MAFIEGRGAGAEAGAGRNLFFAVNTMARIMNGYTQ